MTNVAETIGPDAITPIIDRHLAELRRPGVLSVRPGYRFVRGWITDTPAIVVTVRRKATPADPAEALPTSIDGVAVDVREASPGKRLRLTDPARYSQVVAPHPDAGVVPEFADERNLAAPAVDPAHGSRPGAPAAWGAVDTVGTRTAVAPAAGTAQPRKPQIIYTPPAQAPLVPVTGPATIHLSASPDAGWPTLQPFLAATTSTLTVGMYDFTSKHILETVESALVGKKVHLVLDHPPTNPTADQTDDQTVADLSTALGGNFSQAWALDQLDPHAAAAMFPTAYHIKVAVRDSSAFWLSSGNWNNSNQPDINPVTTPTDAGAARSGDRDWHVIVEQPVLARTFESYLLNDYQLAKAHDQAVTGGSAATATPGATGAAQATATRAAEAPAAQAQGAPEPAIDEPAAVVPAGQTPAFRQFFPATTVTANMTITPLLTPDTGVYVNAIKALIESAVTSLYLQFQYIQLPPMTSAASQAFVDLVAAVAGRHTAGVDVKIIMSEFESQGYLEQLHAAGIDVLNDVKIQNNVHNKGIIVDGSRVLISSQNWSTDGTLRNRDAGVIVDNADAAQYFQNIFLHDWNTLAEQKALAD
jgi:hypothetical protein